MHAHPNDECSRRCLTILCAKSIGSVQVIEQLANAIIIRYPKYIFSDNSSDFIAQELSSWFSSVGVKIAYIEPSSP